MRSSALVLLLAGSAVAQEQKKNHEAYTLSAAITGGQVHVALQTRAGFHINREYPNSFVPSGLDGAPAKINKFATSPCAAPEKNQDCGLTLDLPYKPQPAQSTVGGKLSVGLCNADSCLIEKLDVRLPVLKK